MILHRKDIKKIQEVLDKFPEVETFEIESDHSSGIGAYVTLMFDYEINGIDGKFTAEISSVEDW